MAKKKSTQPKQSNQAGSKSQGREDKNSASDSVQEENDVNLNENEAWFTTFRIQVATLLWKNWVIFTRKTQIWAFAVATPFIVIWMMQLLKGIGTGLEDFGHTDSAILGVDYIEPCKGNYQPSFQSWLTSLLTGEKDQQPDSCVTLGYGIIGAHNDIQAPEYGRYHELMKNVARNHDFKYGEDVKALTAGNQKTMYDYLDENQNKTKYVVMFCHEEWKETIKLTTYKDIGLDEPIPKGATVVSDEERPGGKIRINITKPIDWYLPCRFENKEHGEKDMIVYYILYNTTLTPSNLYTSPDKGLEVDLQLVGLKRALDNSVLEYKAKEKGMKDIPKINMTFQYFPYVADRIFKDLEIITMFGSFYLVITPLAVFMVIFDEMMREKFDNLRRGMQLLGTLDSAYWVSWVITSQVLNIFMSLATIYVGTWAGFDIFLRAPVWIWFGIFFMTTNAYIAMCFFFSTIVQNRSQAFAVNFSIILISMVTNMVLSEPTILKKIFFNIDNIPWVEAVTNLFYLNPCFAFGKLFGDIASVVSARFDTLSLSWVNESRDWKYEDFYLEQKGVFFSKDRYVLVAPYQTFKTLVYCTVFYGTLAWYFDNTIIENRGVAQPWYFPFSPAYWFPSLFASGREVKSGKQQLQLTRQFSAANRTNTAAHEKKKIIDDELEIQAGNKSRRFDGVRVIGMSKSYDSLVGNHIIEALKEVYFEVAKGELLGIMGHNGAGKSTLINVLCGLVSKKEGNARIFDYEHEGELFRIRKRMGVVSQFDVLWDELTGIEHMQLFQSLKRVDVSNFDQVVAKKLKGVGLQDAGTLTVGRYSGGMRRRMSVALSTMGNPNVILMDEPTTGMDPVSRRLVWTMIQELKLNKCILMSTHAMDEAELLSDKIIVLNHGRIQCVGSPLQLKNIFGNGYRISMICDQKRISDVKFYMGKLAPNAVYLESSGDSGGLVFNIPFDYVKELGNIFPLLNSSSKSTDANLSKLREYVTDVGISQTTLEEVFMAASHLDNQ